MKPAANKFMADYVDVAERKRELFAKHPDARLRGSWELVNVGGEYFIAYTAQCFRTADDPLPGIGTAWEPVPGKTPYTRDSELQNAETSAWGRAIEAMGASQSKRIASADEVRNRGGVVEPQPPAAPSGDRPPVSAQSPAGEPVAVDRPMFEAAPAVSPNQVAHAKTRVRALQAAGYSIDTARKKREIPPLKDTISHADFTRFLEMLDDLEQDNAEMTRPFNERAERDVNVRADVL